MTRAHGTTAAGVAVDLIGQPLTPGRGSVPGVQIVAETTMTNAPYDGTYLLNGVPFRMRAGQPLPPGAVPRPDPNAAPEPEPTVDDAPAKRKRGAAPENRAKADEAETR